MVTFFGSAWIAIVDIHRWHFALFLGADGAHGLHICQRNQKHSLLCFGVKEQHPLLANVDHAWGGTAALTDLLGQESAGAKQRQGAQELNELYFGVLRAEGVHGSYLAQTEGVDLFDFTAEPVLWGQVLLNLWQ